MVDDMPYIIGLGMEVAIDLHNEYKKILDMYKDEKVTVPIKAFFGDMLSRQKARNPYPIVILNNNINMDQLLAINSAMKYPVTYIQGPPGTGKTNTIINTIITAFFNEKTVLFSSYNNHPINGVFDKLTTLKYNEKNIPFPILRIGNIDVMKDSLVYVRNLYEISKKITVYEKTLDKNKDDRKIRAKNLSDLLKKYDEVLDLKERKETIDRLIEYGVNKKNNIQMLPFNTDLQGRQLNSINKRIKNVGDISEEQALRLIDNDYGELMKYLYFTSAGYIKKLNSSKYDDFRSILECENEEIAIKNFISYFKENENIKKIQKIFPIIVATCISSHKLGDGDPVFDITIMDEAGQCNVAVSLVPIVRGKNLMLVGDPQQLKPVILLNEMVNERLKNKYLITDEYDYIKNSIYTTYLSCDSLSDEILLHNHYRCNKKIIDFNNKKYYNSKLKIKSNNNEINPLQFVDITDATTNYKNTSPIEVNHIVKYVANNRDKSIGIITPFVNQKKLIDAELERMKINNVTCGTIHAFQGDEKDIILFSTAITDKTYLGTYNWLKNNKELINVATSRAKNKLIVLGSKKNLERLHNSNESDDLYELIEYVQTNGNSIVTPKSSSSRALGVKPFSSRTEAAFLENLSHALENIWLTQSKYVVHKEVAISHVFADNIDYNSLFYSGRFDFVVYEKMGDTEIPILAIELDGKEHIDNEIVKNRDRLKEKICAKHNLQIIRVENSYARRYNYIKDILINYFKIMH